MARAIRLPGKLLRLSGTIEAHQLNCNFVRSLAMASASCKATFSKLSASFAVGYIAQKYHTPCLARSRQSASAPQQARNVLHPWQEAGHIFPSHRLPRHARPKQAGDRFSGYSGSVWPVETQCFRPIALTGLPRVQWRSTRPQQDCARLFSRFDRRRLMASLQQLRIDSRSLRCSVTDRSAAVLYERILGLESTLSQPRKEIRKD